MLDLATFVRISKTTGKSAWNFVVCFLLAVVVLSIVNGGLFAAEATKPNILLIVADDLGWADVGWHGAKIRTPHLDRLAREGVELDRHYVQPVCTPTRTALMSGRYPSRFGPHALQPSNLRAMPLGTETLASALKSVGYETAISGKWHLGSRPEWSPNKYGFDHSYGSLSGAVDPWLHTYRKGVYEKTWHRDGVVLEEQGNATELIAKEAVQRIETMRGPWFLYVPFQAVHIPVDAPDEFKAMYANETFDDDPARDESYKRFAAFVTQMDAKVGEFVAALERTKQRDRTLIIFTSDNGGLEKGGNAYVSQVPPTPRLSSNQPLRGQKGTLYEGGIRVCAFANWPGQLKPRKLAVPMHAVDWFPTLAALAGYRSDKDLRWDGQNLWPALSGTDDSAPPRPLYWAYGQGFVVQQREWKLIAHKGGKSELFHLQTDPFEKSDLATTQPERVTELRRLLDEFRQSDVTQLPDDLVGLAP